MAEKEFDFDGLWYEQLQNWILGFPEDNRPFTVDVFQRARFDLPRGLVGMSGVSTARPADITVRDVATKTAKQLLVLKGVGPKTIEMVEAFLGAHDITLGPANASR
jgi:hypothetical protein